MDEIIAILYLSSINMTIELYWKIIITFPSEFKIYGARTLSSSTVLTPNHMSENIVRSAL